MMAVPFPGGDAKIVSLLSTFVLNTLKHTLKYGVNQAGYCDFLYYNTIIIQNLSVY